MNLSNMINPFHVAIIQHPPVFLNLEQSILKACSLIEEAANHGANVIVFPETWLPGYPVWLDVAPNVAFWDYPPAKALYRLLVENALHLESPHLATVLHMAKKTETHIVMGAHERLGGTLYNTLFYLDKNGQDVRVHRKLMPTYTERMIWGMGDGSTLGVMPTEYGNIGGLICWEHWMPFARAAMHAQQETIHIAQWPAVKDLHQIASRHYAFEGQCFVLAAGCVLRRQDMLDGMRSLETSNNPALEILEAIPGNDSDFLLKGGSAVIAPNTDYLAGPIFEQACILYADIDPKRITEGHLALDTTGHYSRPDIFRLEINDLPQTGVTFASEI